MAINPAVLQGGVLVGTAPVAVYTAPGATHAIVKKAVFTNISAGAVTLTVTSTRSGGSALTIISAQSLAANEAFTASEIGYWVMNPGDVLTATSSVAASINAFINGLTF